MSKRTEKFGRATESFKKNVEGAAFAHPMFEGKKVVGLTDEAAKMFTLTSSFILSVKTRGHTNITLSTKSRVDVKHFFSERLVTPSTSLPDPNEQFFRLSSFLFKLAAL